MKDLLALTSSEVEVLTARVLKWKGLVRFFIHPLFEKWHYQPDQYHTHPNYKRLVEIEKVLSRLVLLPESMTPPIIIMEEDYRIKKLKDWAQQNCCNQIGQCIYYVKTYPNTPHPVVIPESFDLTTNWESLVERLNLIGISKIIMGGMQFKASRHKTDWTAKPPWVGYCVGIALSYLSKDKAGKFDIDLSALIDCSYSRQIYVQCVNESRLKSIQTTACT